MDSILNSIKKLLGLDESYTAFDTDIIMLINGAFAHLHQLGVGPSTGYSIEGSDEEWSEYEDDFRILPMVQQYVFLKVKTVFDPPTSSSVLDAYERSIQDYEWRIQIGKECPGSSGGGENSE